MKQGGLLTFSVEVNGQILEYVHMRRVGNSGHIDVLRSNCLNGCLTDIKHKCIYQRNIVPSSVHLLRLASLQITAQFTQESDWTASSQIRLQILFERDSGQGAQC